MSWFYCYLSGLHLLYRRRDDPEVYVSVIVIMLQLFLVLDISFLIGVRVPTTDELGNKWVVRLLIGLPLYFINRRFLGVDEDVYLEYAPYSKSKTIVVTLTIFLGTLLMAYMMRLR